MTTQEQFEEWLEQTHKGMVQGITMMFSVLQGNEKLVQNALLQWYQEAKEAYDAKENT